MSNSIYCAKHDRFWHRSLAVCPECHPDGPDLEARPAAPLAPDPLPAGAVEFEERLHATILEMVNEWFKVYIPYAKGAGIRPLTNKLAAKIERHFASKIPAVPESGAPAPNLREAGKRAALIRLLWDAHRDIGEWMQLANAIRDEGALPTNHGRCPTARAILASAALRGHIAAKIASLDEAQAESVSGANGPIPSQIEPGEKDQDGSGKPVAGAKAPSEKGCPHNSQQAPPLAFEGKASRTCICCGKKFPTGHAADLCAYCKPGAASRQKEGEQSCA